jgi:signal transduction histidine kinase
MHLTTADGLADNNILSLAMDSDRAIWVGTADGLHRISDGVLSNFGPGQGLPAESVSAISTARGGGVWLGFTDGSVFRETRGQFHRVSKSSTAAGKAIRALCEDSAGRIWIGTAGGRVGCLVDNRFLNWDLPAGSPDKSISGIVITDDGDPWIGTDRSVYSVAQRDLNVWLSGEAPLRPQLVFRADSVPATSPGYGWPRALKSPDGALWFATDSGMVTIDLAGTTTDSSSPPVLIEDIEANGRPLPHALLKTANASAKEPHQPVRLSSHLNSLNVHFTALDLSAPEKIRFRHRLDGYDLDWVVDNEQTRNVPYGRLPYGNYTFHVQAGNEDSTWFENGPSFSFLVPTPLWRAPWVLAIYALSALALVGGTARLISARRFQRKLATVAAQRAMERERMRIARDMHDEIGSKLTKISFMSERAKRELQGQDPVAQKLDSIAGTSRDLLQTLDEIVWAVNPHNDTLEHLAAYLGQYATEYLQNTAVECELRIPRGLPHHPLSAEARHNLFLAFEESLNNALKHGRPTRVHVQMQLQASQFEIRIEDNGHGFDSRTSDDPPDESVAAGSRTGNGLRNMRQRLALLSGQCNIESRPGHGTTVILTVPLVPETAAKLNHSI